MRFGFILVCLIVVTGAFVQVNAQSDAAPKESLSIRDLADLAPSDAAVFIGIADASNWKNRFPDHPLSKSLVHMLPGHTRSSDWRRLRYSMNMSQDDIVEKYMGKGVAIVASHLSEGASVVLISRTDPADSQLLIDNMQLAEMEDQPASKLGCRYYMTANEETAIAISDRWVFMSSMLHTEYMRFIIDSAAEKKSLNTSPKFNKVLDHIQGDPLALAYVVDGEEELHFAWMAMNGQSLSIRYRGKSPYLAGLMHRASHDPGNPMMLLPEKTMAAINFHMDQVEVEEAHPVDQFIAPHKLNRDILGRIRSPITIFVNAQTSETQQYEGQTPEMPNLGIVFEMSDVALANDLDTILGNLASVTALTQQMANKHAQMTGGVQVEPVQVRAIKHENSFYRTANIGPSLAARGQMPALKSIQLTWGRVDNRYVICTREEDFRKCATTCKATPTKPVTEVEAAEKKKHAVASASIRAQLMAAYIRQWLAYERMRSMSRQSLGGYGRMPTELRHRMRMLDTTADSLEMVDQIEMKFVAGEDEYFHGNIEVTSFEQPADQ